MNKNSTSALYIVIFAICIVLCNQVIHLLHLYKQEKIQYVHSKNERMGGAVFEFNKQTTDINNCALSFDTNTNTLTFILNNRVINYFLSPSDNIQAITERSYYDIRDPRHWTLKKLYSYLGEKTDSARLNNASLQLILTDSVGNIKDSYPGKVASTPSLPEYRDTLGFISRDILYATYDNPLGGFAQTSIEPIAMTILITLLLIFCIINVYHNFRNEKRSGEHREQYIHSIVHDLKLPVENQNKLCYLLRHVEKAEQAEYLKQSEQELNEMLQSIDRILLRSTDIHGLKLNPQTFDLEKMLETMIQPNRWNVKNGKEFHIRLHFQASDRMITADPNFLHAVIQNLIDNSLKYSKEQAEIVITCTTPDENHMRLEIKDNGQGIPPKALKRVFDRYQRGNHQGDKKIKGHGLGLHYTRLIIKAHGGKINIDSTPGEGTTIMITLPKKTKERKYR